MHRSRRRAPLIAAAGLGLTLAPGADAQTIRGVVVDGSSGEPVSLAGVSLLDAERRHLTVAVADSLGRYTLAVPDSGAYFLVAQRFGYIDVESPLLSVSGSRDYALDLELQPEPLGLAPITVTVRNEQLIDWLTLELGANPVQFFGFRLLQGARLAEAKLKAENNPTETLRWLYIPVWHGGRCVSINSVPRAQSVSWSRGPRTRAFVPGGAPAGTRSAGDIAAELDPGRGCGSLMVDDRVVPNELIESVDMSKVAVIVTLPGSVRMYTYEFGWGFRNR